MAEPLPWSSRGSALGSSRPAGDMKRVRRAEANWAAVSRRRWHNAFVQGLLAAAAGVWAGINKAGSQSPYDPATH